MNTICINWDANLNPEDVDAASKKVAQKATFKKFVVDSIAEPAENTITISMR